MTWFIFAILSSKPQLSCCSQTMRLSVIYKIIYNIFWHIYTRCGLQFNPDLSGSPFLREAVEEHVG